MQYEWTSNDIEILTSNYANYTVKQLKETFFKNLSASQIKNKIFSLGLTKTKPKCVWTEDEREIVRRYYAVYTNKELKENFLNNKTETQIKDCASTLGIKKDIRATRGWTQDCIDILNVYYNDLSAKEIHEKFLPQFTPKQIAEFASGCLGIHKDEEVIARNRLLAQNEATLNSKPQQIVDDMLNKLGIKFTREEIFSFYSVDNYLSDYNLIIEVQGDYWHMNPIKQYARTKKRDSYVKKDIRKNKYIHEKYNINILYLWEHDILYHTDVCNMMIVKYIENNGIMEDYHSFNYELNTAGDLIPLPNKYIIGY